MSGFAVLDHEPKERQAGAEFERRLEVEILALGGRDFFLVQFKRDPTPEVARDAEKLLRDHPEILGKRAASAA